PGSFGGYHRGCTNAEIHCAAYSGHDLNLIRFVLASQLTEVLASCVPALQKGWDCGYSTGESLSRALASERYPAQVARFATATTWLNSERPDWVSRVALTDIDRTAIGCSTLFLNYLHYQLGFEWEKVVAAAPSPTRGLADTYRQLTGRTDAF